LRRPSANPTIILKEAAASYRVDTDAIATKVRQEFAAKEKAKKATQPTSSAQRKQPRANHPRGGEP
jgi:ParB family chromosome partitioning protein